MDDLLEKYWVKPSKKKAAEFTNPPKDTMTKLGVCSMIIEPHTFDITLFSVKEASHQFAPSSITPAPAPTLAIPGLPSPSAPLASAASQMPKMSSTADPTSDFTPSPDPVIQMLASRAATDAELKSLMKVVAQGEATPNQLQIFQGHIDDLNQIIQAQKEAAASRQNLSGILASAAGGTYPLLKSKAPSARHDISAVVFEVNAGTGDRFLIPRFSIIEYLLGNTQVKISFLLRIPNPTSGTAHQPVSMRLSSNNARVLEPLSRAVASREDTYRVWKLLLSSEPS